VIDPAELEPDAPPDVPPDPPDSDPPVTTLEVAATMLVSADEPEPGPLPVVCWIGGRSSAQMLFLDVFRHAARWSSQGELVGRPQMSLSHA
jgi:hypothetical protein